MQKTLLPTLWWVMDGACSLASYDLSARPSESGASLHSKLNFQFVFRNAGDKCAEQICLFKGVRKEFSIRLTKFRKGSDTMNLPLDKCDKTFVANHTAQANCPHVLPSPNKASEMSFTNNICGHLIRVVFATGSDVRFREI